MGMYDECVLIDPIHKKDHLQVGLGIPWIYE